MASEIRNNFVQSKMNKDLDDRLLQPGEYREASNVNISRSEGEDVGALENVLGNDLLSDFNLNTPSLEVIGYISDETNNRAFFMATDYTDSSEDGLSNVATTFTSHYVLMFDFKSNTPKTLVQGSFLNFSKRSSIYGINIIEDLLFWTDNRNQPRKININNAINNSFYYIEEETISVAKYYPYNAPYVHDDLTIGYSSCQQVNLRPTSATQGINNTPVTELTVDEQDFNKVKVSYIYKRTKQDFTYPERLDIPPGISTIGAASQNDRFASVFWIKEKREEVVTAEIFNNNVGSGYSNDRVYVEGGDGNLVLQIFTVDANGGILTFGLYDNQGQGQFFPGGTGYTNNGIYTVEAPLNGTSAQIQVTSVNYKIRLNGLASKSLPPTQTPGSVRFTYPTGTNKSEKWLPVTSIGEISVPNTSFGATVLENVEPDRFFLIQNIKGKWPEAGMKLTCPGKDSAWNSSGGVTNSEYIIKQVNRLNSTQTPSLQVRQVSDNPFQYSFNALGSSDQINEGSISGSCIAKCEYAPLNENGDPLIVAGDYVQFQSPNPNYESEWPGDSAYLEDKFVRFAYRYKFDDGEYSLISPFTQPVFIPKQNGYFIDYVDESDTQRIKKQEDDVGATTVIPFMENKVNNIGINIETPTIVSNLKDKYKIVEIDILYKESNSLNIMLVQSISTDSDEIINNNSVIFKYDYQSKKPFKLLPEREITRVSDKVPIRALTQSVVGNRVIYGNFIDKHSPPDGLDYNVGVSAKYTLDQNLGWNMPNFNDFENQAPFNPTFSIISYPNHSLKQNRTYQVGIVLSDKYGRQSDVILSTDEESSFVLPTSGPDFGFGLIGAALGPNTSTTSFGGSTAYSKYNDFFPDYPTPNWSNNRLGENGGWVYRDGIWNGNSLKVLFRNKIPSTQTGEFSKGYPGLYKPAKSFLTLAASVSGSSVIELTSKPFDVKKGDIAFIDSSFVVVTDVDIEDKKITLNKQISATAPTFITFNGVQNELGWYTYKIVVKQTEQDYYNAYLPNLSLASDVSSLNNTSEDVNLGDDKVNYYSSLISDNINKLPPDLNKVQPEQTQFSTSDDVLYPRVGYNTILPENDNYNNVSSGFYQGQQFVQVNGIGKLEDLGLQSVKVNGVKLGRVEITTGGASNTKGRVVYNVETTQDQVVNPGALGSGCRVKVGVTQNGLSEPNYVVVTHPGRDYENGQLIAVPGHGPNTGTGWVEGQCTWSSFVFTLGTSTPPGGVDEPFGEDIEPRQAPGILNASSNPSVIALSNNARLPIGQSSDANNNVFSALEIKPLNSNLDIFWETSTTGLIHDLNISIDGNKEAETLT